MSFFIVNPRRKRVENDRHPQQVLLNHDIGMLP